MTTEQILRAVEGAIDTGHWMVRTDDGGLSFGCFRWKPTGQWTSPETFSEEPSCDTGGLFGQTKEASSFGMARSRIVFCETGERRIIIDGDKIKTDRARILLVNDLSPAKGMRFDGHLSLACVGLTALPEDLKVGGDIDLRGCTALESLPEGLEVGGRISL